jgi:chromosome segregation ATPase
MELDQIIKKLEWLDEERRKDKATIATLEERIAAYESPITLLQNQIKDLDAGLAKLSGVHGRIDKFESLVAQYRSEMPKQVEDVEKRREKHDQDVEKRRRAEVDNINKALSDLHKAVEALPDLKKGLQARMEEDSRLARLITEGERRIEDIARADEELKRAQRIAEEARKQDQKRVTDLQGELAAIRRRSEEARDKADITSDNLRVIDTRINELLSSESERKQAQMAFIEQQNLAQVDRDRQWKDWNNRFDAFSKQTANLDAQLASLEDTQRSVKRSQETFEDINQRLERRINEITEMQRLAEDRQRQEWVTFKADDQKRWTNYTLSQEEWQKDLRSRLEKLAERIAELSDSVQTQQDLLEQTTEVTEKQMQEMMNWAHEWLTTYERIMGRARTK